MRRHQALLFVLALALVGSCTASGESSSLSNDAGTTTTTDSTALTFTPANGCGTCPSGTTCGTANGIPVCRSTATSIPRFSHVFVIMMENTSLPNLTSSKNASATPYFQSLAANWATSSNYHGVAHPSLPNYIALTSGSTQNIGCDCQPSGNKCSLFCLASCACPRAAMHLGDQLEAAGLAWKNYGEDMGSSCNLVGSGNYVPRHVPFLYYQNVQGDSARCNAHVQDYSHFATDLAASAPSYSIIAPNLIDDMHDGGSARFANGNAWLSANVPPILASSAFTNGGLLLIVFDENEALGQNTPIPFYLLSPYAKQGGFVSTQRIDHYALLATIQDGLGVGRLGNSVGATPLADFFPAN